MKRGSSFPGGHAHLPGAPRDAHKSWLDAKCPWVALIIYQQKGRGAELQAPQGFSLAACVQNTHHGLSNGRRAFNVLSLDFVVLDWLFFSEWRNCCVYIVLIPFMSECFKNVGMTLVCFRTLIRTWGGSHAWYCQPVCHLGGWDRYAEVWGQLRLNGKTQSQTK